MRKREGGLAHDVGTLIRSECLASGVDTSDRPAVATLAVCSVHVEPELSQVFRQGDDDLERDASLHPFHGGDILKRPLR